MRNDNTIPPNEEGVTAPDDLELLTPAEVAAKGENAQSSIQNLLRGSAANLAEGIATVYPLAAYVVQSDENWGAGINEWTKMYPDVPINPRKRVDTVCKFMYGPDRPHKQDESESTKQRWKRANRMSHIIREALLRGVPAGEILDYLCHIEKPEGLLRAFQERRRNGGRGSAPVPGTATGATQTGRPLRVKVTQVGTPVLDTPPTSPRPLMAVQQPSETGEVVIEITGGKPPLVGPSNGAKLPSGEMWGYLRGKKPDLKAFYNAKGRQPVLACGIFEKGDDGKYTLHLSWAKERKRVQNGTRSAPSSGTSRNDASSPNTSRAAGVRPVGAARPSQPLAKAGQRQPRPTASPSTARTSPATPAQNMQQRRVLPRQF